MERCLCSRTRGTADSFFPSGRVRGTFWLYLSLAVFQLLGSLSWEMQLPFSLNRGVCSSTMKCFPWMHAAF